MEDIRLELLTDEIVSYRYYPEGGEEYGIVSLNRKTNEVVHDKAYPNVSGMYKRQAVYRMRRYNEAGEFPEKATVIWY
ncbi:MAG: hypothetical protein IJP89_06485 [Synergistaceae bacterium]|nr:hypothetical protein [Synergistaceae bacterium]